jgi:hypothetical protein
MKSLLLWLILVWTVSAAPLLENSPDSVTLRFWQAMQKDDMAAAKALTVRKKIETTLPVKVHITQVSVGKGEAEEGYAHVPTALRFTLPVQGVEALECNATFSTELLRIDGSWRVDGILTMQRFDDAVRKGLTACARTLLQKSLDEGMKELELLFDSQGKAFAETLQRSMQLWQQEMLKALEEMERALQKSRKEPPSAPPVPLPAPEKGEKI